MPDPQDHRFVDVLDAEHADLEAVLSTIDDEAWDRPTPAEGWTVKDSLSHLADTEEIARHTVTGGPRALALEVERLGGDVIAGGVAAGRDRSGPDVLDWFRKASSYDRSALRRVDVGLRIPWGIGMGWRAFVTARLMEAWAHGLEIRAALGRPGEDTDRLAHIAWLSLSSLPYAFHVAGVEVPEGRTLRLELRAPDGEAWTFGPAEATDVVRGEAGSWCRRAVQRATVEEVAAAVERDGPLAELAFVHARCFL